MIFPSINAVRICILIYEHKCLSVECPFLISKNVHDHLLGEEKALKLWSLDSCHEKKSKKPLRPVTRGS